MRAMGEVDDVQHAVDQRQPQRHQRVDRPGQEAVEHGGEDDLGGEHQCGLTLSATTRLIRDATRLRLRLRARSDVPARLARPDQTGGPGKTGLASAKASGKITLMSPFCTCVFTGAAPMFWPLTNFVGP